MDVAFIITAVVGGIFIIGSIVYSFIKFKKTKSNMFDMMKDAQEQQKAELKEQREHEIRKIEAEKGIKKDSFKCPSCQGTMEQKQGYKECPFCGNRK